MKIPVLCPFFGANLIAASTDLASVSQAQVAPEKMVRVPDEKAAFASFGVPGTEVVQVNEKAAAACRRPCSRNWTQQNPCRFHTPTASRQACEQRPFLDPI